VEILHQIYLFVVWLLETFFQQFPREKNNLEI
jgi:ABC-type glycerol-3-phosphate transport system permease component